MSRWLTNIRGLKLSLLLIVSAIVIIAYVVAIRAITMPPVDLSQLVISTELAQRLRGHVDYLASPELKGRKPGTPGNRAAAQYIQEAFHQVGLEPLASLGGYGQTISPALGDNLIAVRRARSPHPKERWLLVGAHYDHLGESWGKIYAGADDNASAVGILLETARATEPLIHYSIAFVAFNAEEAPFIRTPLMGSQYFVDHLPAEIGSPGQLQAVIIMDLMGGVHWEPLRDVVFAAGAEHSPGLYRHVTHLHEAQDDGQGLMVHPIGMHVIEEIPVLGQTPFSDYDAFRNASVPYLFLSAGRTPRYHQPSDLPDTLHYERMALTVRWIHDVLLNIDQDPHPYGFEPNRLELADEVATLRPLITKAATWDTSIPGTSPASLLRLKLDANWLATLDPNHAGSDDITRLEHASLRMQCLLGDFSGCFLL